MTERSIYEQKSHSWSAVLDAAQALRDAEQALHDAVKQARRDGNSWQDVGDALDVSRQAAQQRFG